MYGSNQYERMLKVGRCQYSDILVGEGEVDLKSIVVTGINCRMLEKHN